MRPTSREVAEWFAFAFHARRKRPRMCHNADGSPKLLHLTRRRANKIALKHQHSYWCPMHRGWHVGAKRRT